MILSVRRSSARSALAVNYTLSHCHGSPDGFGGVTTNVSSGYNQPKNPGYDDGNCTVDRLHNFSASGSVTTPRFDGSTLRAVGSGWRLAGSFRALTGSWLTITTNNVDRAQNGQTGTQRANQVSDNVLVDQTTNPANGFIRYLDPTAFALPALGTFGNTSRNIIRGPEHQEPRSVVDAGVRRVELPEHRSAPRRVQRVQLVRTGQPHCGGRLPDIRPNQQRGRSPARPAACGEVHVLGARG